MGETTGISWADKTFNPWIGCTNVSPACNNCYAESMANRWGWAEWGAGKPRRITKNWGDPPKWERAAIRSGTRPRVFCASLADWADAEVSPVWQKRLFDEVIRPTPHLEWLLLSKRHARIKPLLDEHAKGLTNIRVGVTVEDDHHAKMRLPYLRELHAIGWPTFVSYEPALGDVAWEDWIDCIDWLIVGGESGAGARHPQPAWFRHARDVCANNNVPFHLKQWGAVRPGAMLDGREHYEFPVMKEAA